MIRIIQLRKQKTKPKKQSKDIGKKIKESYKSFANKLIGNHLFKNTRFDRLKLKLKQADLTITPGMYMSLIILTGTLITLTSIPVYYYLFKEILSFSSWPLYTIALIAVTGGVAFAYFPFVVSSKISKRKSLIDRHLPFVLSELSILASSGLTPIKIFRNISQRREESPINSEFKKIIYKIDIEGNDIITALSSTAKETPSNSFRETLWDIGNMIHQGGDLDIYLREKADSSMQLKRDVQKEFIDTIATYSELYISLVLVGILFIGIIAFLMDTMRSDMAGISADSMLLLLAYGLIPVTVIAVNVIVSMTYSKSG